MKEFTKWFNENKEIWPHSPHDENDCGMSWKAALEWVLKNRKPCYDLEDKKVVATDSDILYKELEE